MSIYKKGVLDYKDHPELDLSKKIFISFPTHAFKDKEEIEFQILNAVSTFFCIDLNKIFICGSAHIGQSVGKGTTFQEGVSDLDLSIADISLYEKYFQLSYKISKGYSEYRLFKNDDDIIKAFQSYLLKGIFRPDLMPFCEEKTSWMKFFDELSFQHRSSFSKITCSLYMSNYFYINKQVPVVKKIKELNV